MQAKWSADFKDVQKLRHGKEIESVEHESSSGIGWKKTYLISRMKIFLTAVQNITKYHLSGLYSLP
jgi:hypothetical protein